MTLAELRARLEQIQDERRQIHEAAGEAALTDEQQTRWEQLDTEERELNTQVTEAEEREARAARVAESRARWGSTQLGTRVDPHDTSEDVRTASPQRARSRALACLDDRDLAGHLEDRQRTHLERTIRTSNPNVNGVLIARLAVMTSSEAYRSAWMKVATQVQPILTAEEGRALLEVNEFRAASLTDASGGYAVPTIIDPTVVLTAQGSPNDILRLARVETITNDEWKGLSSAGVTWKFGAEASASTDNAPTIAQPTVTTRRADGFIPFSIEIGQDWPQFAAEMNTLLSEGYSELLAEKLTTGTSGSSEPIGLITRLDATTTIEKELGTAATVAAGDIYGLWDALPKRWRRAPGCAWMSSTDAQNDIRQLGTVDPNFTVNMTEEGIARMFGREFPTNDYMQDVPAGTGTQALLVVGDFKQYLVAQRAGMSVELVPHLFDVTNNRPTGQRGWYAWARVGADTLTTAAFRLLVNKSA